MKHWIKDAHFRSLLKNSSYLGVSKAIAAVAGIATLAFAARGLRVTLLGKLILIVSYAKAASGLSKFQSWQLIVRYGGRALAGGEQEEFKASTGFAFALDVVSGIGGMILAVMLLPFVGQWFGITDQHLWLAMLYCTLLPTMGAATPVGVLRALDRFDLISWQASSYPIARAVLAGIAFASGAPIEAYVAIWFVTDLGGDLVLWFLAWRELHRRGLLEGIRPTLRPEALPGAWRFAIHVNLTSSLSTAWGMPRSLNAGDAFFAMAQESVLAAPAELTAADRLQATRILDGGSRDLLDALFAANGNADPVAIGQRALLPAAMALGALLGGADAGASQRLAELGRAWATMEPEALSRQLASDPGRWLAT